MDIEEPQSFSNPLEKLWEHSNEQIVLQYVLGYWTRIGRTNIRFPEKHNRAEFPPAFAFAIGTVNC